VKRHATLLKALANQPRLKLALDSAPDSIFRKISRIFLKIDKDPPFLLSQSNIDTLVAIKLSVQKQLSLCLCDCVVLFFDQYWFTEDGDGWGDGDGW